jgi:cell division inhibitor SepF
MSRFFNKTMSFLGLAEEEVERDYEQRDVLLEDAEDPGQEDQLHGKRRSRGSSFGRDNKVTSIETVRQGKKTKVYILEPHDFDDVQKIGDSFKANIPSIINLQNATQDLSKRVIDFCSGLSYALGGSIKKVADKVFLLTPQNVAVRSEDSDMEIDCDIYNQS